MSAAYPNHYDTLQISPRAEEEVIRGAYRELINKHYPQGIKGDEELAKRLIQANLVLSDPATRAKYDQELKTPGQTMVGPYVILKEIAEGSIGDTYLAEHSVLGEKSCIKHCSRISLEAEKIMYDEVKAVWDLRHYALPTMRDFFRLDDGTIAIAMSYIPGPTLYEIVHVNGSLDPENLMWIVERLSNAIMYMHDNGVIHGDIKPHNIIVQPDIHMSALVDFGHSLKAPTASSRPKGYTDVFSPPEQKACKPLVPESDYYSLGMTMIYALTGDLKHTARQEVPSNIPDAIKQLIKRLTFKDVISRYDPHMDLIDLVRSVRVAAFGRPNSNMKAIPNFS